MAATKIVWVIEAYSYDPEDVVGVFSSKEKAIVFLETNGWTWHETLGNGESGWSHSDGWRRANVIPHTIDKS